MRSPVPPGAIGAFAVLKLDSSLKRDHAGGAIASESNTQQPRRRRDRAFKRSESGWNRRAGDAGFHLAWQSEVGMIECVEHLSVEAEGDSLLDWNGLGDIDVGARVVRSAYRVTASIAELTVCR